MTASFGPLTQPAWPPIQLSDNTLVIAYPVGQTKWSTDRSTFTSVGAGVSLGPICRDASDNIYTWSQGSTQFQAFLKGPGHTWTGATTPPAGNVPVSLAGGLATVLGFWWTATGGLGGAGQLICVFNEGTDTYVYAADAGAILGGTKPTVLGTTINNSSVATQDGFGGPGFWAFVALSGGFTWQYVTVNVSSITVGSSVASGFPVGGGTGPIVADRYAPGACIVVRPSVFVAEISAGGLIYAPTAMAFPSPAVGGTMAPDGSYASSVGKLWVYYADSGGNLIRVGITPGSVPAVDGATTTEATYGTTFWDYTHGLALPTQAILTKSSSGIIDYVGNPANAADGFFGGSDTYAAAPNADTLLAPTGGISLDATATITLTGRYNSTDGAPSNGRAIRIKVSGGAYQYYNASTHTLVGSEVINTVDSSGTAIADAPGATWAMVLPAGLLSNGNAENWSSRSQESYGSLGGSYAADATFATHLPPTVTLTGPGSTITTATPLMVWTAAAASGTSLTDWQVIVEDGTPSTVPGSGIQVYASGWVSGAPGQFQLPVGAIPLNDTLYRFFVEVRQTGGQTSTWSFLDGTVTFDAPALPALTAVAELDGNGVPYVLVTVHGQDNIMSADDSTVEGTAGTHGTVRTNCTVARSSSWAADGSFSLGMTASAGGDMQEETDGAYPVTVGSTYTARVTVHPAVTRSCKVGIVWRNTGGTQVGGIAYGTAVSCTGGIATPLEVVAVCPAGAAKADISTYVVSASSGQVVYADEWGIMPGAGVPWAIGGLSGGTQIQVYSTDQNSPSLTELPDSPFAVSAGEVVTVDDYFAPIALPRTYYAIVSYMSGAESVTSGITAGVTATLPSTTVGYLCDPADPAGTSVELDVVPGFSSIAGVQIPPLQSNLRHETMTLIYGLGSMVATVERDVVQLPTWSLTWDVTDPDVYADQVALIDGQITLMYRSMAGGVNYVICGPDLSDVTLIQPQQDRDAGIWAPHVLSVLMSATSAP